MRGQGDSVEVLLDGAGHDFTRDIGTRAVHRGQGAVGVILRLVESGSIGPGGGGDDLGQGVVARDGPLLLQRHPTFHDPGQALLAVADNEQIDEWCQEFGILATRPASNDQRMLHRAFTGMKAEYRRDRASSTGSCSRPRTGD